MKSSSVRGFGSALAIVRGFRGNARTCVLTEPLWGIPYFLYVPYASLYMLELGMDAATIGSVTAMAMVLQMVWSFSSGYITDRLGRRRTSLIFDMVSWTLPTLIWAFAQNVYFFVAAAALNSLVRVVHISWTCLFVEDTEPAERVHVFTWISVAGVVSGFFAPIAGMIVGRFSLVPSMRGLYLFACGMMTAMFLIRNAYTRETEVGLRRMAETKGQRFREVLADYGSVVRALASDPLTALALAFAVLSNFNIQYRNVFVSIVLYKGIGIPQAAIALFPAMASVIILIIYLFLMPRIDDRRIPFALGSGFACNFAANLLLLVAPEGGFAFVVLSTALNAAATALIQPLVDTVLANSVDEERRAKVMSVVYFVMFGAAAPFNLLAGLAAEANPRLPAAIVMAVAAAGSGLAWALSRAGFGRAGGAGAGTGRRGVGLDLPED